MQTLPRHRAWLPAIAAAAIALFALSFVPAWITSERVVLGEGPRTITAHLDAWTGYALPVVAAGAVAELFGAVFATLAWLRPSALSRWLLLAVALLGFGLLAGSLWPVSQQGLASGVTLTPGWALGIGVALAAIVAGGALSLAGLSGRMLAGSAAVGVLIAGAGVGGRALGLNLGEGTGRHYSPGSYTRQATAGQPTERLTLTANTYQFGDRWSGTYDGTGLVVALTNDPACPAVRASYHVKRAGEGDDITWEKIIDTCRDGARAADLQAGVWVRQP